MIITAQQALLDMVESNKYRETNGPNRSPAIDALCREFGLPLGVSWCALFVSKGFKLASESGAQGIPFHYTAGSQDLLCWFLKNGLTSTDVQDTLKWKGALAIRTNPDKAHGHVVLIQGRVRGSDDKIVALNTLEGNTNRTGSSNGEGAYANRRVLPLKPYKWTFCNTSAIAGGAYWK